MQKNDKLSWSSMQALLTCGQKFDFAQLQRLERLPFAGSFNRLRGTFFHAGIDAALQGKNVWGAMVRCREQEELKAAQIVDPRQLQEVGDTLKRALKEAKDLVDYYLPQLGFGTRITPVESEGEFTVPFMEGFDFNGRYDAIIIDTETKQRLLVDWKLRTSFSDIDALMLDGQLYAYAWALGQLGKPVDGIRFYEFKAKLPSPASMQVKGGVPTGVPNTGAASYDTTWEAWSATVREYGAVDPEIYRNQMEGKLKDASEWMNVVDLPLTPFSLAETERRLAAARELLAFTKAQVVKTAAYSSFVCGGCDFQKICVLARHGLDTSGVVKQYYGKRQ
jgi:hypothetical protein